MAVRYMGHQCAITFLQPQDRSACACTPCGLRAMALVEGENSLEWLPSLTPRQHWGRKGYKVAWPRDIRLSEPGCSTRKQLVGAELAMLAIVESCRFR